MKKTGRSVVIYAFSLKKLSERKPKQTKRME
jgi:hypothetical protein